MWWDHVELIFDVAFSVELAIKFMAEDVLMFLGKDCTWNCLDLLLVVSAIAQRAAESGTPKLSVTRNVRLFRVTRILRVIRVVKICQSLRIMIFAILKSLDALLWVFAVLIFFKYLFAMVFMHATTEEFREYGNTSAEHLIKLKHDFGGLFQSFCTLFKVITNGRSWDEVYDSLSEVHAIYGLVFLAYVYFTVFLVLNVVVGTVVDVTSRVALRDRDRKVTEEMSKVKEYAEDVRQFFSMADSNKSGTLSWEEFCEYLEDDKTKAHFQSLDLDISQAHVLFDLLDDNGDGVVGIREFLDGCIRLRGQARSIDLHLAIFQLQQLLSGSSTLSRAIANSRPVRQAGTEAWRS
jgi:voltage-gated sodium channel